MHSQFLRQKIKMFELGQARSLIHEIKHIKYDVEVLLCEKAM